MVSIARRNGKLPFVSVIVPTLNRKKYLKDCLNSLLKIDYPRSRFEVIVVDGGSTDGTKELVEKNFPEVKFILEKRKGISYARNTGEKNADGQIVAYTDDDCVVDRGWIKKLVSGFTSPKIGGVGGPTYLLHPELIPKKFLEETVLGLFSFGEKTCPVNLLITANLAVRHDVFKKAEFDVLLGRRGNVLYSWEEDVDFCKNLLELGYMLLYVPDAKVYHNVDPKRATFRYILKRAFYGGISAYLVERKRKSKIALIARSLRSVAGALISFYQKRTITDFHWLIKVTSVFLASIVLP